MSERGTHTTAPSAAEQSAGSQSGRTPHGDHDGAAARRGRHGRWFVLVFVAAALGVAWWVWQPLGLGPEGDSASRPAGGSGPPAVPVRLAEVQSGSIAETAEAVGTFRSRRLVTLRFQGAGRIERVNFEEGEELQAGRVLAELDDDAQQARVTEAEARAAEASNQLERGRRLFEQGHIAEAELEDRRARAKEAQGQLDEAEAALRDRFVIAPYAGRVGTTPVEVGSVVAVGDRLTDLRGLDALEVAFFVPAELRRRLAVGQTVEVRSTSLGEDVLSGTVAAIAAQADVSTRGLEVIARLDAPEGRIAPGAFATVSVVLERRDETLLIPAEALVLEGRSSYVYRVGDDDTIERVEVTPGVRRRGQVEIRAGLQAGQRIVAAGIQKVGEGQRVRPLGDGGGQPADTGEPAGASQQAEGGQGHQGDAAGPGDE